MQIYISFDTLILVTNKKRKNTTDQSFALPQHKNITGYISVSMSYPSTMLRAFTLLCKLNSYKLSDKVLFDVTLAHLDLVHQTCPCCGSSTNHKIYSSYERNMISISNGSRKNYTVTIPRIKCHCGHTHAILPDVLIPYGSYSLRFILLVLCEYLNRRCSVEDLCYKYEIVKSTLYSWIHLFIDHHNLLAGILNSIDKLCLSAIDWVYSFTSLSLEFFSSFHFSFLQPHHVTTDLDTT